MSANDRQVGGDHYKTKGLQHWDIAAMFDLDYFQGQVTKYLLRWRKKGGIQDLEKAMHYLEKYIEIQKAKEGDLVIRPKKPEPKSLTPEEAERFRNQPLTQKLFYPSSTPEYTYEGGTARKDMYRCRKCKEHFEVPRGEPPVTYHAHSEDQA